MVQTGSNYKPRIEGIFDSAVDSCAFVKPFALHVEFADQTNIGDVLTKTRIPFSTEPPYYKNRSLFELSQDVPLIVFSNAVIQEPERSGNKLVRALRSLLKDDMDKDTGSIRLTEGRTEQSWLKQDPFHRDDIGSADNATLLYKPLEQERNVPTYYASYDSVQQAIRQISETNISEEIREALLAMAEEGYSFSSRSNEVAERRTMLGTEYEDFNLHVFSIIPDEDKHEQHWQKGQAEVILCSNQPGGILHGRPASQSDLENCLTGISLYPS